MGSIVGADVVTEPVQSGHTPWLPGVVLCLCSIGHWSPATGRVFASSQGGDGDEQQKTALKKVEKHCRCFCSWKALLQIWHRKRSTRHGQPSDKEFAERHRDFFLWRD